MILGRVVGTVVATRKDERLVGAKLLLVRTIDPYGKDEAGYTVAVDTVGRAIGIEEIERAQAGALVDMAAVAHALYASAQA